MIEAANNILINDLMRKKKVATYFKLCFLPLLILICYAPLKDAGFAYDDYFALVNNRDTLTSTDLSEFLHHDFWGQEMTSDKSHRSYRPIVIFIWRQFRHFMGSYVSNGPFDEYWKNIDHPILKDRSQAEKVAIDQTHVYIASSIFHLLNLSLHIVNSILVFEMISRLYALFNRERKGEETRYLYVLSPYVVSILWAIHPVNSEAISGIVGLADILGGTFFLSGLVFYMNQLSNGVSFVSLFMSLPFFILTILCKETFIVMPILMGGIYLLHLCKYQDHEKVALPEAKKDKAIIDQKEAEEDDISTFSKVKKILSDILLTAVVLVITLLGYIHIRRQISGGDIGVGNELLRRQESPLTLLTGLPAILSIAYYHAVYVSLILSPYRLSADYSYNCIPHIEDFNDERNLVTLATYLTIFSLFFFGLISSIRGLEVHTKFVYNHKRQLVPSNVYEIFFTTHADYLIILIGITWSCITFLPASNIFIFVGSAIAERILYMPSLGYCILVEKFFFTLSNEIISIFMNTVYKGSATDTEANSKRSKIKLFTSAVLYVIFVVGLSTKYAFTANRMAHVWRSEETLFENAYNVCPTSVKVLNNLAIMHRRQSDYVMSLRLFEMIRTIDPTYCDITYQYGLTLTIINRYNEALDYLELAMDCKFVAVQAFVLIQKLQSTIFTIDQSPKGKELSEKVKEIMSKIPDKVNSMNEVVLEEKDYNDKEKVNCHRKYNQAKEKINSTLWERSANTLLTIIKAREDDACKAYAHPAANVLTNFLKKNIINKPSGEMDDSLNPELFSIYAQLMHHMGQKEVARKNYFMSAMTKRNQKQDFFGCEKDLGQAITIDGSNDKETNDDLLQFWYIRCMAETFNNLSGKDQMPKCVTIFDHAQNLLKNKNKLLREQVKSIVNSINKLESCRRAYNKFSA